MTAFRGCSSEPKCAIWLLRGGPVGGGWGTKGVAEGHKLDCMGIEEDGSGSPPSQM